MEHLEAYLHNFFYSSNDIETLSRYTDEGSRFRSKQGITLILDQIVRLGGIAECAWVYSPTGDEKEFLARSAYTGLGNVELLQIRDQIIDIIEKNGKHSIAINDRWSLITTEGFGYYLWMIPVKDAFCGAWIRVSYLGKRYESAFANYNNNAVILSTLAGEQLTSRDDQYQLIANDNGWTMLAENTICVTSFSNRADLAISAMLPKDDILRDVRIEFDYALFAAVLVVFVLIAVFTFQSLMYQPFHRVSKTLREVSDGNLYLRFEKTSRLKEINTLERSINQLLDVIHDLKMNVYETTCQYLRIRLKTHFYLNCLNIIHSMARVKNTDLIKEMTVYLSEYLRFIDKENDEFIKLEDELSHARNYARIQELRFPNVFQYIEDVPAELYEISIPPLILQTFIENSVEHAMEKDHINWVRIQAADESRCNLPGIRLKVADSGKGFDSEILRSLSDKFEKPDVNQGNSIGIRNVVSRLSLIYNGKADIVFSNTDGGGALIDMWLPTGT
jgi:two-component system sensor histidine kinase YesM